MTDPGNAAGVGLRAAFAVARRDLLEFVRDRRTLFITLLMPMAMSLMVPGSKGRTTIWLGSGAPTLASALMGVGDP